MALKFNFKVTWTPQTIMIEEKTKFWKIHPKCCFWCLWPKCSFPYINSTHVENSSHFPHIEIYCQERLAISSHSALMWGKGFLTFPQPIFNFLTFWMCGIGCNDFPHTFPHTRPSRKIKRKIPYIFPMCGTLFSLHQFHTCGKFLTFSSLFPHIFFTLKFHSVRKPEGFPEVQRTWDAKQRTYALCGFEAAFALSSSSLPF